MTTINDYRFGSRWHHQAPVKTGETANGLTILRNPIPQWAARLRMLRAHDAIDSKTVCECTGISAASLSRAESGIGTPSLQTALRLACFYEMTVEALFGDLKDVPNTHDVSGRRTPAQNPPRRKASKSPSTTENPITATTRP